MCLYLCVQTSDLCINIQLICVFLFLLLAQLSVSVLREASRLTHMRTCIQLIIGHTCKLVGKLKFLCCAVYTCVSLHTHTQHTGAHEVSCHQYVASQHAHVLLQLGVQLSLVLRVASNITHSFIFVYLILSSSL